MFLVVYHSYLAGRSQPFLSNKQADSIINLLPGNFPRYFDSHIHSTNMDYYTGIPDPALIGYGRYSLDSIKYFNWKINRKRINNKGNNAKNYRQADYNTINTSGASILCTSISPIEKRFTKGFWKQLINHLIVTRFSSRRIKTTHAIPSYNEFIGEYRYTLAQSPTSADGNSKYITPVKNKQELIENFKMGHTSLLFSLEGGHILDGDSVTLNELYNYGIFSDTAQRDIMRHVDSIKSRPYHVFFITLAHFAWNGITGFCKTLDENNVGLRGALATLSGNENFRIWLFKKYGDGILEYTYSDSVLGNECDYVRDTMRHKVGGDTPIIRTTFGFDVIKKLLDTAEGQKRVLIDVKHMDIKARFQYYDSLDRYYPGTPIIFSHGAVSGKNRAYAEYTGLYPNFDIYREVQPPYKLAKDKERCRVVRGITYSDSLFWFYPWSINLCNEEIPIIYNSDGIIGITLDDRLLGGGRPNYKSGKKNIKEFMKGLHRYSDKEIKTFLQMQPLFRNIFYLVQHSGRSDSSAWEHLVMGTDFDGFIKPVKYCKTASEIPKLWALLNKFLPLYEQYVYNDPTHKFLYGLSTKQIADNLIFKNGERFALKYF